MAHTIWRRWQTWAAVFGAFTVLGCINAVQFYTVLVLRGMSPGWPAILAGTLPFWYAKAALMPGVVWAGARFPLDRPGGLLRAPLHLVLAVAFAGTQIVLGAMVSAVLVPTPGTLAGQIGRLLGTYFVIGFAFYFLLLGIVYGIRYYDRFRERERAAAEFESKASRLEASLAHARLDALRMQLNPHFLFNTLNSIGTLAMMGEGRDVVRMLNRLAAVLRVTLENSRHTVPLQRELDFLQQYLEIEQVRFGERLSVVRQVAPTALGAEVSSLILQPIVENALRHGVGGRLGPVTLEIGADVRDQRLHLWVTDSGRGFPARFRRGVGLQNTEGRLHEMYGTEARLEISPPGSGARVEIVLPYSAAPSVTVEPETALVA